MKTKNNMNNVWIYKSAIDNGRRPPFYLCSLFLKSFTPSPFPYSRFVFLVDSDADRDLVLLDPYVMKHSSVAVVRPVQGAPDKFLLFTYNFFHQTDPEQGKIITRWHVYWFGLLGFARTSVCLSVCDANKKFSNGLEVKADPVVFETWISWFTFFSLVFYIRFSIWITNIGTTFDFLLHIS